MEIDHSLIAWKKRLTVVTPAVKASDNLEIIILYFESITIANEVYTSAVQTYFILLF